MLRPIFIACLIAFAASPSAIRAGEVTLAGGRQLRADRVYRSDDGQAVILEQSRPGIRMSRRVPIEQVAGVSAAGGQSPTRAASSAKSRVQPVAQWAPHLPPQPPFVIESGVPVDSACDPCLFFGPGRVIGVRQDPLDAYADLLYQYYPAGVPTSERGVVLDLLRAKRAQDVLGIPAAPLPEVLPPTVIPNGPRTEPVPHMEIAPAGPVAALPTAGRPRQLVATATPRNSAGRMDWDEIIVELSSLDAHGHNVPLRGVVHATLWGQRQRLVPAAGPRLVARPGRLVELDSWTRAVNDATSIGTAIRLPLSRPLPDHDLSVAPLGELHVAVDVPGVGRIETAIPEIELRHASTVRDRAVIETGSLFLPGESTTDSRLPFTPRSEMRSSLLR